MMSSDNATIHRAIRDVEFEEVENFHRAIRDGEIGDVERLLEMIAPDRHYYDAGQNSAASVAVRCGKLETYELLISKGICLGLHESIKELLAGQPETKEKRTEKEEKIRSLHRRYFNRLDAEHLRNLISQSWVSHESPLSEHPQFRRLVAGAFEDLNGLPLIVPILKVASTASNLKIVFDFNRSSVEFMDPTKQKNVQGTTYPKSAYILIGAKDLSTDIKPIARRRRSRRRRNRVEGLSTGSKTKSNADKRNEVLGVLIHELTHFVMHLIYNNDAKPYYRHANEKTLEFTQIVAATKVNKDSERWIKGVYDYAESQHHAELIVRVPHLAALYKDDEDKYCEVSNEFSELFDFFAKNVDLTREFSLIIMKQEIREANELSGNLNSLKNSIVETTPQALESLKLDFSSNNENQFISSNCPRITLRAIYEQVRNTENFDTSYIFADCRSIEVEKVFTLIAETLKRYAHVTLIIDCARGRGVIVIAQKFKENNVRNRILFVDDRSIEPSIEQEIKTIDHSWNHLSENFKNCLLGKSVCFNGADMKLRNLFKDLSAIKPIPFDQLLGDQKIQIGKKVKLENLEKLIDRKFLTPDSKQTWRENYDIELDFDEVFVVFVYFQESKTFLISDQPGMGKSTTLKMLQSRLLEKFPSSWIVFMDLKVHFKAYQKQRVEFKSRKEIAKFFTEKILKIEGFEAEVFAQLFNENRVVVLFDGLDEICPSFKQFIFGLMTDIQKLSNNLLWMSTRPHLVEELRSILKPIELTLKPFTEANRREFFKKHFEGDQNFEQKLEDVEGFLQKFIITKFSYGRYSVSHPLLMRMIVEILEADPDLKLSETNMFEVYRDFSRKMVARALDKGQDARNDIAGMVDNSNIADFYSKEAFVAVFNYESSRTVFDDKSSRELREELIDPLFSYVSAPTSDEIVRVGLMFGDGSGQFYFTHQTFAEFYVAKFFVDSIFNPKTQRAEEDLKRIAKFFLDGVLKVDIINGGCQFSLFLLESIFENDESINSFDFPRAAKKIFEDELVYYHFDLLVVKANLSLIKLFALRLRPRIRDILFSRDCSEHLLCVAFRWRNSCFIDGFLSFLNQTDSERTKEMFLYKDLGGQNILHCAASHGLLELAVERCKSFMRNEQIAVRLMQNSLYGSVLHRALDRGQDVEKVITILKRKLIESNQSIFGSQALEKFLLEQNEKGLTALDMAIGKASDSDLEATKKFYFEVFGGEKVKSIAFGKRDLEISLASEKDVLCEASKYFIKLRPFVYQGRKLERFSAFIGSLFEINKQTVTEAILSTKNEKGETFLMIAAKVQTAASFNEFLIFSEDRIEILKAKNAKSECVFHYAAKNENLGTFERVVELYRENFENPEFKEIICGCNESWLFDVIERNYESRTKTLSVLFTLMKELFEEESAKAVEKFFLFADESGKTVLMKAAESQLKEFEAVLSFMKENFPIGKIKDFLLAEDKSGANAFVYSLKSGSVNTFDAVKQSYEEIFKPDKIKEIALKKVNVLNMIAYCIENSETKPFSSLCKFMFDLFSDDKQKIENFFTDIDESNRTILMQVADNDEENFFEVLANFLETSLGEDEIKKILVLQNRNSWTALHWAIASRSRPSEGFKLVVDFYSRLLDREAMKKLISGNVNWEEILIESNNFEQFLVLIEDLFSDDKPKLREFFMKTHNSSPSLLGSMKTWDLAESLIIKKKAVKAMENVVLFLRKQFPEDDEIKENIKDLDLILQLYRDFLARFPLTFA